MLLSVIPFFIDIVSTVFFCTTCRWPRHFFSHFFCVLYNKYFSVSLLRSIAVQFFILSISYVYIAPAVSFHVQTVVQCWLHSPTLLPWFSCCKGRDFFLFIFYYLPLQLFFCAVGRVCTKAWRSLCHFFLHVLYNKYFLSSLLGVDCRLVLYGTVSFFIFHAITRKFRFRAC
jgi:hypothetical protein